MRMWHVHAHAHEREERKENAHAHAHAHAHTSSHPCACMRPGHAHRHPHPRPRTRPPDARSRPRACGSSSSVLTMKAAIKRRGRGEEEEKKKSRRRDLPEHTARVSMCTREGSRQAGAPEQPRDVRKAPQPRGCGGAKARALHTPTSLMGGPPQSSFWLAQATQRNCPEGQCGPCGATFRGGCQAHTETTRWNGSRRAVFDSKTVRARLLSGCSSRHSSRSAFAADKE